VKGMVMTKEELEQRVKDLEAELAATDELLKQERAMYMNKEFEMLRRLYPYLANEVDAYRRREA
jgi:hypothetical protein